MTTFSGQRLRLARTAAGLTQVALAEQVATSPGYLSDLELGKREPGEDLVRALGEVLGFDASFFYGEPLTVFEPEEVNFRHRASTSDSLKGQIAAKASLFRLVAEHLDEHLGFPPFDVPSVKATGTAEIEDAARRCREAWGLGLDTPVASMIRVAERAGLVLVEFEEAKKVDAFSAVKDGVGIVVLNATQSAASRRRWSIAHEIGHLVLHRGMVTGHKEREEEAERFAAAFLLPHERFGREFRALPKVDWPHLFELKRRWKVSVAAIVRRAYLLRLLPAVNYRRLYKSLSARGWLVDEPNEPPIETPELLPLALQTFEERFGISSHELAEALRWAPQTMAKVTGIPVRLPLPRNVESLARYRARRQEVPEENGPAPAS